MHFGIEVTGVARKNNCDQLEPVPTCQLQAFQFNDLWEQLGWIADVIGDDSMDNGIPDWLNETPAESLRPPTITRIQELPFSELTWKNFERLCYRLACSVSNVERCRLYGNEGDEQEGIDIFARTSNSSRYVVYQCKREKDFGPQKIRDAVDVFLSGEWLEKSCEFTLCTQESLQGKKRADAIEEMADKLREHNVILTPWDATELNRLLKDQHKLVADFFDPAWADAFCGPQRAPDRKLPQREHAAFGQYKNWVSRVTSTYDVPGLSVSMSIRDAWMELRAMNDEKDRRESKVAFEKALQNYHEWFRLGDEFDSGRFSADSLHNSMNCCVIIGGPGSGKSTLCRRIAFQSTAHGKLVVLVRLKRVQRLMAAGDSFSDALAHDSTDGTGLSLNDARCLLSSASALIADGLDECDPQRREIAKKITDWSLGHPSVSVLVTTRPVGHHPNLLPEFRSFELLPLNEKSVEAHSRRLFEESLGKGSECAGRWLAFCAELREDKKSGKSLAARNPLLLGFLVRLAIDGIEIGSNRCELFGQILQLMAANPRVGDIGVGAADISHQSINAVAFHLVSDPIQTIDQLAMNVSSQTNGKCSVQAVREAIDAWEDRRCIERVSAGHLAAIVFVHASLGEYCAARHVATLDDQSLRDWIRGCARKPMWRQVVLLAAQLDSRVVPRLVELSDGSDLCSIEANIAAEAIAENASLQKHMESVCGVLVARISSKNPLVSIESALALRPIAKYMDALPTLLDETLLKHEQEWTRLAALSLLIQTESSTVLQYFEEWLQTFTYHSSFAFWRRSEIETAPMPSEAGDLQHEIIKVGLPALLEARTSEHIETYFRNGRDWGVGVSMAIFQTIRSTLIAAGFAELAEHLQRDLRFTEPNFDNTNQEPTLVDGLIAACGFQSIESTQDEASDLTWIQTIVAALKMGECPCSDGAYLRRRIGFTEFSEVLKGVVAAIVPNLDELRSELSVAKGRIAKDGTLYTLYTNALTKEPDWGLAAKANLDCLLLEKALGHPHAAARYGAACLLHGGAAGAGLAELVSRVLSNGNRYATAYAARLICQAFPTDYHEEAITILRRELRPGFEYLVTALLKPENKELLSSLKPDIAVWLRHPDPYFVVHIVDDLRAHVTSSDLELTDELRDAFQWWSAQGTWCREHKQPTQRGSCPECNLCLPSPKAELLSLLSELHFFGCTDLFPILSDKNRDVERAAKTAVLNVLRRDCSSVLTVLDAISSAQIPIQFLNNVSELPATALKPHRAAFEKLLQSPNEAIRNQAMHNLTSPWMSCEEAIVWAEKFVTEENPSTIISATRILRQLRNG